MAKEHLTIDQWDAFDSLLGLPCGDVWDLERGWAEPNFQALSYHQDDRRGPCGVSEVRPFAGAGCRCLWHSFLDDVTGGDEHMAEGLQVSIGASLYGGQS